MDFDEDMNMIKVDGNMLPNNNKRNNVRVT